MTNTEILTQFEAIIGDTLGDTLELQLANNAKNRLETELQLEVTKKLDTSNNSTVGGTYLTSYTLPADILMPLDTIYVGTKPRRAIPLEQRMLYKDSSDFFYVDWRQSKFYLCGTVGTSENITLPYIYTTPDILNDTNTVIVWPTRFHSLVPYEMAFLYFAIDQTEKQKSLSQEWQLAYQLLKNSLVAWDQRLKLNAIGSATPYGDSELSYGENRINNLP